MDGTNGPDRRRRPDQDGPPDGVVQRLVRSVRDDDVSGLAAEIAYRFLFAVFPFGLFVAALGAFIASTLGVADPAAQLVAALGDNLPPSIAASVQPELEHLLSTARPGLLAFGAVAALWAATGATNALSKGIHRAYDIREQRPFLLRYAIAVGLTMLAAIGFVAAFVTIVGGAVATEEVAQRAGLGAQAWSLLQLLRWPVVFAVLTMAVAVLYRYAPSVVVPWRWIAVGAVAFTGGWLIATAALAIYVENVADYGATYGSLGGVIVLMLWFYITSALLILGAELTAALAHERSPSEIHQRGEERAAAEAVGQVARQAERAAPTR
jgi:membrane protein